MLILIIRTKFVALLVGATGMGLSSMYMSSLTMLVTIFGMGINMSVVRDLSKANDEGDNERFSLVVKVFERMLLFLSVCGTLFVIATSSFLSNWSFGTNEHTLDYCFLSVIVLFTLLTQGNTARMIGKRKVKDVALSSLIGSIVTLLTSVPFFYFWRMDGIVPGLIVSTIANYLITMVFARRIKIPSVRICFRDIQSYGLSILFLGFTMVLASLLGNITVYLINVCITRLGGIEDLGLFNAGMSMTQQVVSLVFAAMAADYYPRLVASLKELDQMNETINQQTEILLYLSTPILCAFSIFSIFIIQILLSDEFLVLNTFIRILCFGMFFKVVSYALGYVSFAKGDKKIYLILEGCVGNALNLLFSVLFYYLWGLKGIAYAFVCNYFVYLAIIYILDEKRYHYKISPSILRPLLVNLSFVTVILIFDWLLTGFNYYIVAIATLVLVIYYNVNKLNNKTSIISFVREKINRIL